jgi:hypothetical protein
MQTAGAQRNGLVAQMLALQWRRPFGHQGGQPGNGSTAQQCALRCSAC